MTQDRAPASAETEPGLPVPKGAAFARPPGFLPDAPLMRRDRVEAILLARLQTGEADTNELLCLFTGDNDLHRLGRARRRTQPYVPLLLIYEAVKALEAAGYVTGRRLPGAGAPLTIWSIPARCPSASPLVPRLGPG